MENYTIDLAQLGQRVGGAPKIGSRQPDQNGGTQKNEDLLVQDDLRDVSSDEEDFMGGYEINLGALGDKPSSVVVEDREPQRDEVDSEDDGPNDFTVNLEKWMRGTEKWRKEQGNSATAEDHEPDEDAPEEAHDVEVQDADAEGSVFEPLGTSTPAPLKNQAIIQEGVEEEAKLLAPPLSRLNTETLQDRAAEEVFDRISALQAEVERMQTEEETRHSAHQALEEENQKLKRDLESTRQRHEARDRALKGKFEELQRVHADTKSLLQYEKNQLKQDYESALERLRAFEEQPPTDQSSELEPLRKMYEDAVQELEVAKAEAEANRIATDTKNKALATELQASKEESQVLRTDLGLIRDANSTEINLLNTELEARNNEVALERKESIQRANELAENGQEHARKLAERDEEHSRKIQSLQGENRAIKNELDHAQQQLRETHRIIETVEDENDRLVQQNERQAQDLKDFEAVVKGHETKAPAPEPVVEKMDNKVALEALSQQHQTELSSLEATHAKELQLLRAALQQAAQAMRKREAKLTKAHDDEIAVLNEDIAALKRQPIKETQSDLGIETELRSAIRVLNNRLSTANASLASARVEAVEARRKAEDAVRNNAIVNAELEARFAQTVEAREREWRRRIRLLFKERERLGKALMWGWGREECGPRGEKETEQGYRYKYLSK
jgi:hypothetical protein